MRIDNPPAPTSVASYHYTATVPLPLGALAGASLVGEDDAPVNTPSQGEWDSLVAIGSTVPCASLDPGVWLLQIQWSADGADLAGQTAFAALMDAQAIPSPSLQPVPGATEQRTVVLDAPTRVYVCVGADNDDETRVFGVQLWATKIADVA
jgi:hypothetical protein